MITSIIGHRQKHKTVEKKKGQLPQANFVDGGPTDVAGLNTVIKSVTEFFL